MKVHVPLWVPDPPYDFVSDRIAGHLNLAGNRTPGSTTFNTLVHFTGRRIEQPLRALSQTLSSRRRQNQSIVVILVLPAGTLDNSPAIHRWVRARI